MFDGGGGLSDQFHQFTGTSSRTSVPPPPPPPPLPLSFPLHHHGSLTQSSFPAFDPFPNIPSPHHDHQSAVLLQLQTQQHLHHLLPHKEDEEEEEDHHHEKLELVVNSSLELERERSDLCWSNAEVLALLRIRSSMENWLPDFTWEHVSRKLAELGFRRSGETCKQKFEEESSRHLDMNMSSTTSSSYTKKYYTMRPFFSELEQLCHGENSSQVLAENNQDIMDNLPDDEEEEQEETDRRISFEEDSRNIETAVVIGKSNSSEENEKRSSENKKRKRHGRHRRKFEMLKGFCEEIVNKMMAQQEELHSKIIEDMARRDEEKIAREEAWKKQEMERMNKEIEIRAHEQAVAGDRQTKLIHLLKKYFTPTDPSHQNQSSGERNENGNENVAEISKGVTSFSATSSSLIQPQNPNPIRQPSQNPSSMATQKNPCPILPHDQNPSSTFPQITPTNDRITRSPENPNLEVKKGSREDIGKRWPRDEVLALINLRCSSSFNSSGINEDKELGGGAAAAKGPLWERISQGMLELGYKRSAKRCKEKWENINKYFRKTKDVNKKRSLDSRTCPYFHQLNALYSQGTPPVAPFDDPENQSALPENRLATPEVHPAGKPEGGSSDGVWEEFASSTGFRH